MKTNSWIKRCTLFGCFLLCLAACGPAFAESQQASGVTAQTVIDQARYYLASTGDSFFTDSTEMLDWVNAGISDISDIAKCLEATEQITLQTGVTAYAISTNYLSVEAAVYSGATSTYVSSNYKGLKRVQIEAMGHTEDAGEPVQFYTWNDKFYVDPKPASGVSGYTIMLYLIERSSGVTLSQAIPTPAAYDDALALFVASRAAIKDKRWDIASKLYGLYTQIISLHTGRAQTLQGDKVK